MTKDFDSPLLTAEESAQFLRVHRATVYRLIKAGTLKPRKIGRLTFLHREELERFAASDGPAATRVA